MIPDEAIAAGLAAWGQWPVGVSPKRQMINILEAAAPHLNKPNTITTVAELDALPIGTVVLSDCYRHFVDGWQVAFQRWHDGEWHRGARAICTHPDNFLPATVLYEPAP